MAPDIAIDRLGSIDAKQSVTVLDPMCGSGTTLVEAASQGHSAIGFDVDPLAVLMSSVATTLVDTELVISVARKVIECAAASTRSKPRWDDPETIKFAEFWFADKQRTELNRLSQQIDTVDDKKIRQALQVALSRTIITKTPQASLAADTSHSRPHRVITESEYDVLKGFERSVKNLCKLLDQQNIVGEVCVSRGDARELSLRSSSVDLVITSPPYLNAIDYLRGHRLSLIWVGHTIPELRKIRSNSIGAERALKGDALQEVKEMTDFIKNSVEQEEHLPLATITRYAQDLVRFSKELGRVCRSKAEVVTVIGNSTLRGNYIQNDVLVRKAYENSGFKVRARSERELPENRRYMPVRGSSAASPVAKRMRTEVVLTVQKP